MSTVPPKPTDGNRNTPYALCRQMGHDLRQPLHGLGMLLSVLEQQVSDAFGRQTLTYMNAALRELQGTVDRYASLARQEEAARSSAKAAGDLMGKAVVLVGMGAGSEMRHPLQTLLFEQGALMEIVDDMPGILDAVVSGQQRPAYVIARSSTERLGDSLAGLMSLSQALPGCALAQVVDGVASKQLLDIAQRAGIVLVSWPTPVESLLASLGATIRPADEACICLDFSDGSNNE